MRTSFPYRKILVPIDFSDEARVAVRHAAELGRACGASLALLTVIDDSFPYPELFSWDHPDEEFYKSLRTRALEQMNELIEDLGGEVEIDKIVVRGRPREEIVAMARELEADLVVVGRHGSGALRTAFMGSTAETIVRSSRCAVLVLPPAEAQ